MDYKEQLKHPLWIARRLQVLEAYQYTCRACGNRKNESILDVHHKIYIYGKMAWDYDDYYLVVLCRDCHAELHRGLNLLDNRIKMNYDSPEFIVEILFLFDDIDMYLEGTMGSICDVRKEFGMFLKLKKELQYGRVG